MTVSSGLKSVIRVRGQMRSTWVKCGQHGSNISRLGFSQRQTPKNWTRISGIDVRGTADLWKMIRHFSLLSIF